MRKIYVCDKCKLEFDSEEKCLEHEEKCGGSIIIFVCDKCGKEIQWDENDLYTSTICKNQCHKVNLGYMGYGSKFDGSNIYFNLCDDCIYDWIQTFNNKDRVIHNEVY